ncbi:MAG: SnoaL-like domain-containing protein [Gemmatimonadota bacterium]|nr:SnoaL-like domain-containing protein [Gemmatimonadota bacterium]
MSTTIAPTVAELDRELNATVLEGRILDAFERFYADDVVMQENAATPVAGKAANRERERQFVESIEQFHQAALLGAAAEGDRSYSEWILDVTLKGGLRVKLEQVAVRQWRNGQVTHERFYYNAGNA